MSGSVPPDPGSARSKATNINNDRVSVIRSVLKNNTVISYDNNANSSYFVNDQVVVDNNAANDDVGDVIDSGEGGDRGDGGDGGDDNDISVPSARKKPAQYMTKKRKIEEKQADIETKRALYKAAVEDMENKVEPWTKSYYSCAKHYGLGHTSLKRFCETGAEYVGHSRSNRVIID